ncbi:methylenetetrahydrofolate reductase [NAD(P)H] [Anatilimnocola sp. NA78]|uniref:methylenetetrahydrofolate reductase [NAD(P)H] n=1 Tax=Anatilimnocola sp. NA78 TaxID=3415683 RepID=UPI003CE51785
MTFYPAGKFSLSFELFPPKTAATEAAMYDSVEHLMAFAPDVITCTYGAGGSTREKTLEITTEVKKRFGVRVASHLTCVGTTVDQLRDYLREAGDRGVDNIVALRGDPPKGETSFTPVEGGLRYANELLALIKAEYPKYGVAVAGYPETHQEAPSFEVDMKNLQRKVASGADVVITQLFYDNADFFRFRDECQKLGITAPIIPGILPVTNLSQIQRITSLCKAKLPAEFIAKLGEKDSADWQFDVGVDFATRQVQELIDSGIPGIHFYVLNKSPATSAVLKRVKHPA